MANSFSTTRLGESAAAEATAKPPSVADSPLVAASAIRYAVADNAEVYQPIMRLFYENRQNYGTALSPGEIADALLARYGIGRDIDQLNLDLTQLAAWGSIEGRQDNPRVSRASELARKRFVYDITPAGEECERFLARLGKLRRQAGSLQSERLGSILTSLRLMHAELQRPDPRPSELQRALTSLMAELNELRDGAQNFMRDLNEVVHGTDALDEAVFLDYKSQVIAHLNGFRFALERDGAAIKKALALVDPHIEQLIGLVASIEQGPGYGLTPAEQRERAAEPHRQAWTGLRGWFVDGHDGHPRFELLDAKLIDAISWILRAVNRLKERGSHRVDRSQEYRHLARLFSSSTDEECHAIYAAAFGLFGARHFGSVQEDEDIASGASFWEAPVVDIEARLRNPNRTSSSAGRGSRVTLNPMAREMLGRRREAERRELDEALTRFSGAGVTRLSDIGTLSAVEFEHLLGWLGRALETLPDEHGTRRAESVDGLVTIALTDPHDATQVTLITPNGAFTGPDYQLSVST